MLAKSFQKPGPLSPPQESHASSIVAPRVAVHYGIPSTASVLAFDHIQRLLAIGTLDGRIKLLGGDNIEGLLMSPKPIPFKHLEFLQNQGFLVSVSNENEIQVWDLESRSISSSLQWESNITAFSVIYGTHFMYLGDEYGFLSSLKYDAETGTITHLPYYVPSNLVAGNISFMDWLCERYQMILRSILSSYANPTENVAFRGSTVAEAANISSSFNQSIVGVLPQLSSHGNRLMIAYENGLIFLWDLIEDKAVLVRGNKDLQLKQDTVTGYSNDGSTDPQDSLSDNEQTEKEISSLCWVSTDGSFLAVGYVDGDIFLWNLSVPDTGKGVAVQQQTDKVVKIQLSSSDKRIPVIVLHWSPNKAKNGLGGQLFVYGGEEIGSEEVLTILDLDWSSGMAMLKCVHRIDLPLYGSFSDMMIIPSPGELGKTDSMSLLVLTNPGQLHFYDKACLSTLKSEPEKKHLALAVEYPAAIPITEPRLTVGNFYSVGANYSRVLAKTSAAAKLQVEQTMPSSKMWPFTGGIPGQLSLSEELGIERIYVAGYQDGLVRIWDATHPVLSIIFVFDVQVDGIKVAGASTAISALEFSSTSLSLAVGNESGLVSLYGLDGTYDRSSFHLVSQTDKQVVNHPCSSGSQIKAIFSLQKSPVRSLLWLKSGDRLAVGLDCGLVALLETSSPSVLFVIDTLISPRSTIISLAVRAITDIEKIEQSEDGTAGGSCKEVLFVLTRDANIVVVDCSTGEKMNQPIHSKEELIGISLYILEGSEDHISSFSQHSEAKRKAEPDNHECQSDPVENESSKLNFVQKSEDSIVLLCFENALHLYSSSSLIKGERNCIYELNLAKPCAWTTIFCKEGKEHGLIIVYKNGDIEIRSFIDFSELGSTSLMTILRWNFKINMDSLMSSSDKGQIILVSGNEFAIVSLLAFENDFRIPGSLPCLHDKVLAAAADTTIFLPHVQKNKQSSIPGVLGGIVKGLKGAKAEVNTSDTLENFISHLEAILSRTPFSGTLDDLGLDLNIDDIELDEPLVVLSSSSNNHDKMPLVVTSSSNSNNSDRKEETARSKLFEGSTTDTKPKVRTREEIIAKYRKTGPGDATSAAAEARNKLAERGEKLQKLSDRTAELQSGSENFASLASELAKKMEQRKWWNF